MSLFCSKCIYTFFFFLNVFRSSVVRFCLFLLLLSLIGCKNKSEESSKFTLDGYIDEGEYAWLFYLDFRDKAWIEVVDSAKIVNNHFQFTGEIDGLAGAFLKIDNAYPTRIYLEPKELTLELSKNNMIDYKLINSSVENENLKLRTTMYASNKDLQVLVNTIIDINDQVELQSESVADSLYAVMNQYIIQLQIEYSIRDSLMYDFALNNKSLLIVPDLLYRLTEKGFINIDSLAKINKSIPEQIANTSMRNLAKKQIEWKQNSNVGLFALDFISENLAGDTVSFVDLKQNKYILLDFWASWCGPCLKGIPLVKELNENYAEKLQIINISIDSDSLDWKDAVDKYGMASWTQLKSIEGEKGDVYGLEKVDDMYNVESIPYYVLIDKQGKIIARWQHLGEDELKIIDDVVTKDYTD